MSITSSINLVFGSTVLDPVTGIIVNDQVNSLFVYTSLLRAVISRWTTSRNLVNRISLVYGHLHVRHFLSALRNLRPISISTIISLSDNYPAPGKRPLSSTCPVIIEDANGDVEMVVGGSGGSRIFPAIFQTILGYDWGLDISQAIEYGRVHDQLFPRYVDVDDNYAPAGIQALIDRGHTVQGE